MYAQYLHERAGRPLSKQRPNPAATTLGQTRRCPARFRPAAPRQLSISIYNSKIFAAHRGTWFVRVELASRCAHTGRRLIARDALRARTPGEGLGCAQLSSPRGTPGESWVRLTRNVCVLRGHVHLLAWPVCRRRPRAALDPISRPLREARCGVVGVGWNTGWSHIFHSSPIREECAMARRVT